MPHDHADFPALAAPAPAWNLAALEAHVARLPLQEAARLTLFASGPGAQAVAACCERVTLAAAGLPLVLK